MIVWHRWGILVFFAALLGALLGLSVIKPLFFADAGGGPLLLSFGIGVIISAAVLWVFNAFVLARFLDKPGIKTDPITGQRYEHRPVSKFFWIPMKFWPYILAALGVIFLVLGFTSPAVTA